MQIEFIGCTSAGKSTLVERVVQLNPAQKPAVTSSYDFVLQCARLAWIANRRVRAIALNTLALGMCLLAWRKYKLFLNYTVTFIRQLNADVPLLERLKIFRITLRNVGLHEFVVRYAVSKDVVVTDEGMLQIAHYLFVHIAIGPTEEQIESFAKLVPMPAAVVYVRQPHTLLVERTLQRGHKRIPNASAELVKRFITHATTMFETLIQQPAIHSKLLVIDAQQQILPALAADAEPVLVRVRDLVRPALRTAGRAKTACGVAKQA